MSKSAMALALLAASLTTPSWAATVTETVTGIVAGSSTTDSRGLFGPAGASLKGHTFTLAFQYVSQDFNQSGVCRNKSCTYHNASGTALVPQAVKVTITIGGVTQTYMPKSVAALFLSTQSPPYVSLDSDAYSGFGGYGRGTQLYLLTMSNPKFAAPLSPGNAPLLHRQATDYIAFFDERSQTPIEQLNLNIRHTAP